MKPLIAGVVAALCEGAHGGPIVHWFVTGCATQLSADAIAGAYVLALSVHALAPEVGDALKTRMLIASASWRAWADVKWVAWQLPRLVAARGLTALTLKVLGSALSGLASGVLSMPVLRLVSGLVTGDVQDLQVGLHELLAIFAAYEAIRHLLGHTSSKAGHSE